MIRTKRAGNLHMWRGELNDLIPCPCFTIGRTQYEVAQIPKRMIGLDGPRKWSIKWLNLGCVFCATSWHVPTQLRHLVGAEKEYK
jgi:hypothetical protein